MGERPALTTLPAPPADRRGWPWTIDAVPIDPVPDMSPPVDGWPTLSIVTPSYNQVAYVEETLRSVLKQAYPALDYQVLDGGSNDGSAEIVERYGPWLDHWRSAADGGQSQAIEEGWQAATGDWLYWLNSDDRLEPGALQALAPHLREAARDDRAWVVGRPAVLDDERVEVAEAPHDLTPEDLLFDRRRLAQPAVFVSRTAYERIGGPDLSLHYAMDYDLWLRLMHGTGAPKVVDLVIGVDRLQPEAKTARRWYKTELEMAAVARRHAQAFGVGQAAIAKAWRRRGAAAWSAEAADAAHQGDRLRATSCLLKALLGNPSTVTRQSFRSALGGLAGRKPGPARSEA